MFVTFDELAVKKIETINRKKLKEKIHRNFLSIVIVLTYIIILLVFELGITQSASGIKD